MADGSGTGIKKQHGTGVHVELESKKQHGTEVPMRNWNKDNMKQDVKLGVIESRFADIIWQHEPLGSGELVKLCERELNWKKPTTYTVLRKLCQRGIFRNQEGVVTSLLSREEFYALQSEKFVEETFNGSLPAFLAAFSTRKKLSEKEIDELQKLIDRSRG